MQPIDLTPDGYYERNTAESMALNLLHEHIPTWKFSWDNAKERVGNCSYAKRTISLSRILIPTMTPAQIRDVILHEIAHALAGPYTNHGPTWRRVALSIGCSATVRAENVGPAPGRYRLTCPNGHVTYRHRKSNRISSCSKCSPYFNDKYRFEWEDTNVDL